MSRKILAIFTIAIAALLCSARPAPAGIHQTWEQAHFAKPQTIEQIDKILDDIHARFGKDLMIETFASIPDDLKPAMQKDGKETFYEKWTRSEAFQLGVNGVMILITGDPPHLQVEVGTSTREKAFTIADRDELVGKLADSFRQKDYDTGLLQAAQFVHDRMAKNLGAGGAVQPVTRPAGAQPTSEPTAPASTSSGGPTTRPASTPSH
ncbi:MAG TPA: TPM domain-containing protein [Tepidisphaeraceae bacterium]|nr:TPM domain-containing protein [Tepidisphaeraceae bacterium]